MPYHELTKKQEIFCLKYYELGNASEAARLAGYSQKYQMQNTWNLLQSPLVKARLSELRQIEEEQRQRADERLIMRVVERKQRLSNIGRAKLTDFVDEEGNVTLDAENSEAIAEVSVEDLHGGKDQRAISRTKKLKLHSPIQAIDLLNKMDKLYSDGYMDNRVVTRVVNIFVIDGETKDLISRAGERTKLITDGHKNDQSIQSDP